MSDPTYQRLSPILRRMTNASVDRIEFWCPACDDDHMVELKPPHNWTWNGDVDKPTFDPSVLTTGLLKGRTAEGRWDGTWPRDADNKGIPFRCHIFVREGMIQYLGDCSHEMKNQTVPLPAWYTHETEGTPGRAPLNGVLPDAH